MPTSSGLPNAAPPAMPNAGGGGGKSGGGGGGGKAAPLPPAGARPPQNPLLPLIGARAVVWVALLLTLLRGPALAWALPALAGPLPGAGDQLGRVLHSLARGLATIYLPPGWTVLRMVALIGLVVLLGELALLAGWLVQQRLAMQSRPSQYLRIRTARAEEALHTDAPGGVALIGALHQLLDGQGRHGAAPWLSLVLSGAPDQPVTLGAALAGGTAAQRAGWVATLRKLITGHNPTALVEERPDPLGHALLAGAAACWRVYSLSAPPAHPLRLADAAAVDLLGPMVAAMRPQPGTSYSELQISLRPRADWSLTGGWRVHATRLYLKLRARQVYGLQPDAVAIQQKLDGPTFDVTIRVVTVAATRAELGRARAELETIGAVLGQYVARSSQRVQRLVRVGQGTVIVPALPQRGPSFQQRGAGRGDRPFDLAQGWRLTTDDGRPPCRWWFPRRWRHAPGMAARAAGMAAPAGPPPAGAGPWLALPAPRSVVATPAPAPGAAPPPMPLVPAPAQAPAQAPRGPAQLRWGRVLGAGLIAGLGVLLGTILAALVRGLSAVIAPTWSLGLPEPLRAQLPALLAGVAAAGCAHLWLAWADRALHQAARCAHLRGRAPCVHHLQPILSPVRWWAGPAILSPNELAGLWHLPAPALGHLVDWLPCRVLPAPAHAFTQAAPDRLTLGHAYHTDGSLAPIGPTLRDLRQILHLTAGVGAGKSRLLANLVRQLIDLREDPARPNPLLVLDGKGDDDQGSLVAVVRALLPAEAEARLVILDPLDTTWPIGINPLQGIDLSRPGGADMALGQVLAVFGRLDPETWGKAMGMQQYVRMGALLVLEGEPAPTLAHIKQALLDAAYRADLLERCTNQDVRDFWLISFPQVGETQRMSLDALLRRFDNLLTTETTRYLLTQPHSTFSFERAFDAGLIVLMPMPDITLGGMANLIGMLLYQAIVRAFFARSGSDQTRLTCPLIADEFQVFIGTGDAADLRTALTRLRALGAAQILAHQSLIQLGELRDETLINAANRVLLQTQEPDASVYARQYAASGLTAADIAGQDAQAHQYVTLRVAGQPTGIFSMVPLPWPTAPATAAGPQADDAAWQQVLPSPEAPADRIIAELIYGFDRDHPSAARAAMVGALAQLPEPLWDYWQRRWAVIRAHQRAYLLGHPAAIPAPLERQRWLSRLWAATPRLLAAVQYQRQRHAIEPGVGRAEERGRGKGRGAERAWRGQGEGGAAPAAPDPRHKTTIVMGVDGAPQGSGGVVPAEDGSSDG